jgi:hypothetical protein
MATTQQKSIKEDAETKQGPGFLYVKVSMDGAPYLRKIDLKTYKNYKDLSTALEKMFSGFSTGEMSRVTLHFYKSQYVIVFQFDVDRKNMLGSKQIILDYCHYFDMFYCFRMTNNSVRLLLFCVLW